MQEDHEDWGDLLENSEEVKWRVSKTSSDCSIARVSQKIESDESEWGRSDAGGDAGAFWKS